MWAIPKYRATIPDVLDKPLKFIMPYKPAMIKIILTEIVTAGWCVYFFMIF